MEKKRIYIAPNEVGEVNGIKVRAELLNDRSRYDIRCECPCNDCAFKNKSICFLTIIETKKRISAPTRPACFGNDIENLANATIIYKNEK